MENSISDLYGAFSAEFQMGGQQWLQHIIPEIAPAKKGLKPLDSYFIYCVHPERGSITFIIEQDEKLNWICEHRPPFIDPVLILWIGKTIEEAGLDLFLRYVKGFIIGNIR